MSLEETEKRMEELKPLIIPVMEWIQKYYDPHHKLLVDMSNVQLLAGQFGFDCFDHLND